MTKLQMLADEYKKLAKEPEVNKEKMAEIDREITMLEKLFGYVTNDN